MCMGAWVHAIVEHRMGSAVNYNCLKLNSQLILFLLQLYAAVQVDKPVLLHTLADVGLS